MIERAWTTCTKCNRVVYLEDVNDEGVCCLCPSVVEDKKNDKEKPSHGKPSCT